MWAAKPDTATTRREYQSAPSKRDDLETPRLLSNDGERAATGCISAAVSIGGGSVTAWGSGDDESWFEVHVSVPWVVAGTTGVQNAINIAVSEVGKRVEQSAARYSNIIVQDVACPSCGHEYEAALSTTDFALVVLTVEAEYPAGSVDESVRVAKRELGVRMKDVPLTVLRARRARSVSESDLEAGSESGSEVGDTIENNEVHSSGSTRISHHGE